MIKLTDLLHETISPKKYEIFCDMDGVICDFDSRFKYFTGMLPSEYEAEHGTKEFWKVISKEGVKFWSDMDWMPDGKQLWQHIEKYNPTLLSAPSREESSKTGKRLWVEKIGRAHV